ncbi:hypothetical protein EVAR_43968_1 [Eumeta japonica]|uniref:Ig-like domain-containing protein n=1 Tax=Eumeta variegata TaxID=151549 RepID=A0A4C1Y262_EUMVA|nr:hypothetical protein EVAR_43968_1 [Eumeta japonica]
MKGVKSPSFCSNKGSLKPSDRELYHFLENDLLITDVRDEDAGLYRCQAKNDHVNKMYESKPALVVVSPPAATPPALMVLETKPNVTVEVGKPATLACPVLGWPRPSLATKRIRIIENSVPLFDAINCHSVLSTHMAITTAGFWGSEAECFIRGLGRRLTDKGEGAGDIHSGSRLFQILCVIMRRGKACSKTQISGPGQSRDGILI